jgi:FtsP/CotA-like multicopper oxidase with cupredoxin domain
MAPGTTSLESPKDVRSHNGVLKIDLTLRNSLGPDGNMQFCYLDKMGDRSPTLRVRQSDLVILRLQNKISWHSGDRAKARQISGCNSIAMGPEVTNLHFHGLSISPSCHADDSLRTSIPVSGKAFVYRFRIPATQSPGLYWYHPHVHGHTEDQVLGGASGALIVEGAANATPAIAGLPERVIVIRDQKLQPPAQHVIGNDPNLPAKDLSINFIPVQYPDYSVPTIRMRPLAREFWRVLNASADTYVTLAVVFNGEWQKTRLVANHPSWQRLGLVALDGVPVSESSSSPEKIVWKTEVLVPPGGRAEFTFQAPPQGVQAELLTAGAETTSQDEDDKLNAPSRGNNLSFGDTDDVTPPRPLARIVASDNALEPPAVNRIHVMVNRDELRSLATVSPVRSRKLYFSEEIGDPKNPAIYTSFFITEEGQERKRFDPSALVPNIVVHQGDVEDWTIENRSRESHVFHIHQSHFLVLERNSELADDSYLLDTVDVPYWDGHSAQFPSVKLRMDFRDPEIVGTFPYHCHILQHADGGMMGLIEVLPK